MMKFSETTAMYFKIVFAFLVIIVGIVIVSKQKKFNCDDYANNFRENFECHIVLQKIESETGVVKLLGIDIRTNKAIECDDYTKWMNHNYDKFKFGDTIIKNKGQYSINIRRKKETITIPFTCDVKVYSDSIK